MLKTSTSALFKKDKGFTLIELMIVTLIVALITAIVLINYRVGNRQLALNRSANKLAQDIRRAQEMAMSATACEPCGGIVPPGFGIFLEKDGRKAFAVLPYEEFIRIQEALEDLEDLKTLRQAKIEQTDEPTVSLEETREILDI